MIYFSSILWRPVLQPSLQKGSIFSSTKETKTSSKDGSIFSKRRTEIPSRASGGEGGCWIGAFGGREVQGVAEDRDSL